MGLFKSLLLFALVTFLCGACSSPAKDKRAIFVRAYFKKYPKATLQDIYKGSFQDQFGPAHLLTDREAVKKYILSEMESAESFEKEDYTPCGWQENFYQVNLSVIKDGKVPLDVFVDAFMASANGIDATLTPAFVEEWKQLQQTIRKVMPDLKGFVEDSILLVGLHQEGNYVVHHSQVFNDRYQPHYRIIRKDLFEAHILPKL